MPKLEEEARSSGSFLGYQYPEWLFILLAMFLPLGATVLRFTLFHHRMSAISFLGWTLLHMAAGFAVWLLVMLIIVKLYEHKENRQRSGIVKKP